MRSPVSSLNWSGLSGNCSALSGNYSDRLPIANRLVEVISEIPQQCPANTRFYSGSSHLVTGFAWYNFEKERSQGVYEVYTIFPSQEKICCLKIGHRAA
jgi:hypothetical protein